MQPGLYFGINMILSNKFFTLPDTEAKIAATNNRLAKIFNCGKVEMGDEEVNVMFLFLL